MSRLSFRPRPLNIQQKLHIYRSIKEFEEDDDVVLEFASAEAAASTQNNLLLRSPAIPDSKVHVVPSKKSLQQIPIPQYNLVESYERDHSQNFNQPSYYLRGRRARTEIGEFVEYDLDNEDEEWLEEFNNEKEILTPEKFETILYKLEVLDYKTRERAGVITPTYVSPIPVLLCLDAAFEALQSQSISIPVLQAAYNYWKAKRVKWKRPILRSLQPPLPASDTNPFNVFRRREKVRRLHERRMRRRGENNVQSFEKLRQVRRNLGQAKIILEALIKKEKKKQEIMETDVILQHIQMKYKHDAQFVEDEMTFSSCHCSTELGLTKDNVDLTESDDTTVVQSHAGPAEVYDPCFADSKLMTTNCSGPMKWESDRRTSLNRKFQEDPLEPVLLFTRPLEPEKLAVAGIVPPPNPHTQNGVVEPPYRFNGRIGRGGRLIFDRWNPLLRASFGIANSSSSTVQTNYNPSKPNDLT